MALNLDTLGEGVKRETNVVPATNDYSCVFWVKITALPTGSEYQTLFLTCDDLTTQGEGVAFYTEPDTLNISAYVFNGSGTVTSGVTGFRINRWIPCAYTREGTSHKFYFNGVLAITLTKDVSGDTYNDIILGTDTFPDSVADLNFQYFREWDDRVLTLAELISEWNSPTNVSATDLWTDTPLVSDLLDDSGNGYDWTAVGSTSFIDGPIPVPLTNTTGAAAVIVSALDTEGYIQIVRNSLGVTQSVAYTYTGAAGEQVFGVVFQPQNSAYLPTLSIYDDAGLTFGDIYNFIANYPRRPVEVPILIDQMQLWIRAISNAGNPVAVLHIRFVSFAQQTAAAASYLINDAGSGPSVGLFDSSNGDPLQLLNGFIPGELATILHGQDRMMHDNANSGGTEIRIHNDQLQLVNTLTGTNIRDLKGDREELFYVNDDVGANHEIRSYDRDGNLNETFALDPSAIVVHIAPDPQPFDIIYTNQAVVGGDIRRYSRSAGAFISNLAAGIANYTPKEMLWLNGNTLLVVYIHSSVANASFVRQYNCTDGSTIIDFTSQFADRSGLSSDFHIASDFPVLNPETHFHAWIKIANGYSRFMKIRLSDGAIINSFDRVHFTNGSADNEDEEFGHSESCNFLITDTSIPPPGSPTEGTLIVNKVIVPPDATEFDFTAGGGLSPGSFSLGHGDSQVYSGLTPGSGFSIVEDANPDYDTTYDVSNDETDDNTNITVGAGETVTVTVTNTSNQGGTITLTKITNGSLSAIKFVFTLSGDGIPTTTVELANGESHTFEDLPPGNYTLSEEQLAPGWEIFSIVINDVAGALTEIPVDPDTETIVVVTNQFIPTEGSGIYFIEPGKRNDTLWRANDDTKIVKIPDPNFKTALLGE